MKQTLQGIDKIRKEMDFYQEKKPELTELMDLYYRLFKIEDKYRNKLDIKISILSEDEIIERIAQGRPLISAIDIPVDGELFRSLLSELAVVIVDTSPDFKEPIDKLLKHEDLNPGDDEGQSVFIKNALRFDTQYFNALAESIPIEKEVLLFLVYHAINPFFEKVSYEYRDAFDYARWQNSICPMCGRKPAMALLRKDEGARVLQCSTCRSWWTYPRLKCVICGNDDHEKLQYFFATEDEAHRVYVCDVCKKYIKVTDCRKTDRMIDLDVEDLATIDLDIVAKKRGYAPGGRTTFAFKEE